MNVTRDHAADIQIAVVGMGYWGKNLVRNFAELGALSMVCDADSARGLTVAEAHPDVSFSTEFSDVLGSAAVQGVVIATPAATHFAMAREALEAGKDVYVEKPLALSVLEGEQLVEMATARDRVLMVGHILRYHAAVVRLGEFIEAGELGQIHYIYSNRLNMGKIRTEENILWSFAPHDISVILALLGEEPIEVTCTGGAYLNRDTIDVTMSQFLFPSGVRAHIHVSWLHPFKEQKLVVVGSERMAVFDDTAEVKLVVYPHRVEWKNRVPTAIKAEAEKIELEAQEPLRTECLHFLECVRDRRQPITDGHEGLRVLRVLSACEEALAEPSARSKPPSGGQKADYFAHESAFVDAGAEVGDGTKIWHFSHVMNGAKVGRNCNLGQNVNVAGGAVLGDNVKVQNNVSIYAGALIEDDVFLGPSCVLTNIANPRSQIERHSLYERTLIRRGATVGANATIVCGVEVGRYAFIAAGAVVTRNVSDYALVMGNPAKQKGWMSRHGHRLGEPDSEGIMACAESGHRYREERAGVLRCLDLDEDDPLPADARVGTRSYASLRHGGGG